MPKWFLAISIFGLSIAVCAQVEKPVVTLITLDKQGAPLEFQQLEWWESGREEEKKIIECRASRCGTWEIPAAAFQHGGISMVALKHFDADSQCTAWFAGTATIEIPKTKANYIEVQLTYFNSSCK